VLLVLSAVAIGRFLLRLIPARGILTGAGLARCLKVVPFMWRLRVCLPALG
jgi:hypothetical protein